MASRKSTKIERICEVCHTKFTAEPYIVQRGKGRFCSYVCSNQSRKIPLRERFLRYISPPNENGCVLWTGAIDQKGYGRIGSGSTLRHRPLLAPRVAWELHNGPIPDGLCVLHQCDVPRCVAIEHLFLGTHAANVADKVSKGRQATGESAGGSKLTQEQVQQIRDHFATEGISRHKLAKEYKVSPVTIWMIVKRKTWKYI